MEILAIRPANPADLSSVWAMVTRAVSNMNSRGNFQWNPDYPERDHFSAALDGGNLYLASRADGVLLGCAIFDTDAQPEHDAIPWSTEGDALMVHKMAVDPLAHRSGVGSALFAFAEGLARSKGLPALRMDTFTQNDRMQALVAKLGFSRVGEVHFGGQSLPYPCFEKVLSGKEPSSCQSKR